MNNNSTSTTAMPEMLNAAQSEDGRLTFQQAEKSSARKNNSRCFWKWLFWQHFLREEL
ncbi:MAG: hypothetical protein ACRD63_06635 [Pyrinomonadaceae bacterium]